MILLISLVVLVVGLLLQLVPDRPSLHNTGIVFIITGIVFIIYSLVLGFLILGMVTPVRTENTNVPLVEVVRGKSVVCAVFIDHDKEHHSISSTVGGLTTVPENRIGVRLVKKYNSYGMSLSMTYELVVATDVIQQKNEIVEVTDDSLIWTKVEDK